MEERERERSEKRKEETKGVYALALHICQKVIVAGIPNPRVFCPPHSYFQPNEVLCFVWKIGTCERKRRENIQKEN